MVIRVVEFSSRGTKLERFLLKNQGNYWILRTGVMGRFFSITRTIVSHNGSEQSWKQNTISEIY